MERKTGTPWALFVVIAPLALTACAHRERTIVRLQPGEEVELAKLDLRRQSLVVKLEEGEVIPLDIQVEGDLVGVPAGASVPVTVKRACWLRIDDRGLRVSADGEDFDGAKRLPGSFQLGLGVTREGKRATFRVRTPAAAPAKAAGE
jgi:hypothetical protein